MEPEILFYLLPLAVIYFWYAGIIGKKNKVLEALSSIDVQLKKRSNLIPNILAIAKKFMSHEEKLLTEITQLRSESTSQYSKSDSQSVANHLQKSEALAGKMGQLMVAVENYPDLKSDQTMIQAMQTYNEVEGHISAARRFYNSAVTILNNSVQIFPGNLIAKLANTTAMPFYEADEESKAPINASDILK